MRRTRILASAVSAALLVTAIASTAITSSAQAATATPTPSASASAAASTVVLTTKTHNRPRPSLFTKFSYQTGTLSGANPTGQKLMNQIIAKDVKDTVNTARKENKGPCNAGMKRCANFILRLAAPPCVAGHVCITETVSLQAPGANDVNEGVNTLVFDSKGGNVGLNTFVSDKQTDAFLKAANAGIAAALTKGGISATDKTWKPDQRMKDIQGWIATPEGIHLYYSKYAVAPGSFGIVDFTVPWSAFQ